jgi:hypothetical protein
MASCVLPRRAELRRCALAVAQERLSYSSIAERAAFTLRAPGSPAFLAADEDSV